jgi:three-Cys-motif partner protein
VVEKRYEWAEGAKLDEHSHRKHKILREYVFDYLTVRCRLPQQERFRLAIVDGFAGGGRYQCGSPGSPLIFIEELKRSVEAVNTQRAVQGLGAVEVECLFVFNDASRDAIELLKTHVAPMQAVVSQTCPKLHLRVEYLNEFFEVAYLDIKRLLEQGRYRSVIFNLDQCGHSHVERNTILDIMHSYPAAEIFYTFVIRCWRSSRKTSRSGFAPNSTTSA